MLHYWLIRQFGNATWGLNRRRWDAREQLRIAIVTWIECTYHRRREHQDHTGLSDRVTETVTCPCNKPAKHLAG
jgi:putative transposase